MRGSDRSQDSMFSYGSLEERIPAAHPLRPIRAMVDEALRGLSVQFAKLYAPMGRPSIAPEKMLRALLLMVLYSVRSERRLVEEVNYNFLYRWFVGIGMDEPVWDATTFSKNRERFIDGEVARRFFDQVLRQAREKNLVSEEHFSVDGTLIEAWASLKSFQRKDDSEPKPPSDDPGNPTVNFRGERRGNDTHESTSDPDARLARKSGGQESRMAYCGNAMIENRHGLVVDVELLQANGTAERDAALVMAERIPGGGRVTVAGDKGYDTKDFVAELRGMNVTPHVTQNQSGRRRSAIDGRTTRHEGHRNSQRRRKVIEEVFGWLKTVGGQRKTRYRGIWRVGWIFTLALAAYNLVRMRTLTALPVHSAIASWGINGSNHNTEFLLDGAPNNSQAGGNNVAYVPPVDSVQEFKIQTNSYDAEYGRSGGGSINVVLKSGTNRVHGSVYEFMRRNWLDANSFQNNARGAPKDGHHLDQYGVVLDGPVYLPKIYNGKDRTFFLFNYEGYREGSPQPLILSVPEVEMRDGDFSRLVDARGRRITIYDPATGRNVNGVWTRDAFQGNIIPKARISPIARKIVDYYPLPNTSTAGSNYSRSNYFASGGLNPALDNFYNLVFKFDQNFGARNRVFFRQASNDRTELRGSNGVRGPGEDGQFPLKRVNDAYVIDWVSTISPTMIFNLRSSFSRYIEASRSDADLNFDLTALGFPASLPAQLGAKFGFGMYRLDGYINLGRNFSSNVTNTFAIHPTMTRVSGSRTTKIGLDLRWIQYSDQNSGDVFRLNQSVAFTQQVYNRPDSLSGDSLASWLLGTPSSGTANYPVYPIFMYRYMAPYVQQSWKVLPRLTLDVGLRMDFNFAPVERYNRLNRGFDPTILSPVNQLIDRQAFPDFPTMFGALQFTGVNGAPREAANLYWKTWQPRAGFAWALSKKTVIRGGWGRYFLNPNNDFLQTYGFSNSTSLSSTTDSGRTGIANLIANPFPVVLKPTGASAGPLTFVGRGFNFVNSDFRLPHIDQFSIGIQHAVSSRAKFEITYAGSRGNDLQNKKVFNDVEDAGFRDSCNFMLGGNPSYCDAGQPNPFKNVAAFQGTSFYTSNTESRAQLLRPFPQFAAFTQYMRNDGKSWYNSVQSLFTARTRNGINLNVNYTFSKNMQRGDFLDPLRNIQEQGLAQYDKPHRFTASMISQVPFGSGKRWLNTQNRFVSRLVSGWENTIIFSVSSGLPWTLPTNIIYLKDAKLPTNWSGEAIQAVKPCVLRWNENNTITMQPFSVDYGCTDANWLEVPRYTPRYEPTYDGRIRLQRVAMADVSLNKLTRINERFSAQVRLECFNVANSFFVVSKQFDNNVEHVQFGSLIKAAVSAPESNYPRQMQLGMKLIW